MTRESALLLTFLLAYPAPAAAKPAARHPNVILISIDTLRPDHVGCYGYRRPTTPNLDAFARDSILFEDAISAAPWTLPSHASMFTSLYPNRHGLVQHPKRFSLLSNLRAAADAWRSEGWPGLVARFLKEPRVKPHKMAGRIATLAEEFHREGYQTAAFVAADTLDGAFGLARGFDLYDNHPFRPGSEQTALALDWLDHAGAKPSFVFLHYYDAHGNFGRQVKNGLLMGEYPVYDAPESIRKLFDDGRRGRFDGRIKTLLELYRSGSLTPLDVRTLNALYDAGARRADEHLGAFLAGLKSRGLYDDSVILLTSDHGENLMREHGEILHHTGLSNTLLHVVAVLKPAGKEFKPRRAGGLVRTIDYMPTLLDAAGASPPPEVRRQMRGISLLGPLRAGRLPELEAYSEVDITGYGFPPAKAIQDSTGWKLVYHPATERTELYDLRGDPGESHDRADANPEIAGRLLEKLLRESGVMGANSRPPNVVLLSIDGLRADHLGAYGYARGTSPRLDALASRATVFESHVSASGWTLPSHMSMFSSQYPSYHGLTMVPDPRSARRWLGALRDRAVVLWRTLLREPVVYGPGLRLNRLRPGLELLPEALKAAGYRTGGFTASNFLVSGNGFSRGFDRFVNNPEDTPASRQNEAGLAWIAEKPTAPFFLFLHYYDLHHTLRLEHHAKINRYPYDCPGPSQKEFLGRRPADFDARFRAMEPKRMSRLTPEERGWIEGLYDGCVLRVDSDFGGLVDGLKKLGVYDQTLLVVTSDHGEEFWDHGSWGHGRGLYQEIIHTPLIVKGPQQRAPLRVRSLTSAVDLMPTVLEEAGIPPSRQLRAQMQGTVLRPLEPWRFEGPVFSERDFQDSARAAILPGGWKAVSALEPGKLKLYDLGRDPLEKADAASARPEKLAALEELLYGFFSGTLEH